MNAPTETAALGVEERVDDGAKGDARDPRKAAFRPTSSASGCTARSARRSPTTT